MINSGFVAFDQIILNRNNAEICAGSLSTSDEIPCECTVIRVNRIDVSAGKITVLIIEVFDPSARRLIVMRSGVDYAVMVIIVRQIIALLSGVECELQDLHARISGILNELPYAVGDITQILGDDFDISELFLDCLEERDARSFDPFSVPGCLFAVRNLIKLIKSLDRKSVV